MKTKEDIKSNVYQCLDHLSTMVRLTKEQQTELLAHVIHQMHAEKCVEYIKGRFNHYELPDLKLTLELVGEQWPEHRTSKSTHKK